MENILIKTMLILVMALTSISLNTNGQTKSNLPFIGKKFFENKAYATTYVVTINPNGKTTILAGNPGWDNKGWFVYKGKYKPIMTNNEEGIKIENGFLYLLDKSGTIRKDCLDDNNNECQCKYNIKSEELVK